MSVPPPPEGPWQSRPSPHGQPPWPTSGQSAQGQPHRPPPGQHQGWSPPGPPKKSNALKWALGAVTLIAVIAIAVAVTLAFAHRGSDDGPTNKGNPPTASGFASANDTGPVSVITDEPTCDKFLSINHGMANQQRNGWDKRDPSIPATDWTPQQRAQYQAVGASMRNAADQFVSLAKQTPHRVVRELYQQFIAYARAYADDIGTYTASDDYLALTAVNASSALYSSCSAISQGSASTWSVAVPAAPPSRPVAPGDPANPNRFITAEESVCNDWITRWDRYSTDASAWGRMDPQIPATQWTPEQQAVYDAVKPVMSAYADDIEKLGRRSANSTLQDFAIMSAQYTRAYVQALPTYVASDMYLATTANATEMVIMKACQAAGG